MVGVPTKVIPAGMAMRIDPIVGCPPGLVDVFVTISVNAVVDENATEADEIEVVAVELSVNSVVATAPEVCPVAVSSRDAPRY